jgi:ribosomal protein S18 acetylase RimI-like enzyme
LKREFTFSTLENIQTAEFIEVFNSAFAEYFIKIEINERNFANKIRLENICLEKSVGAFLDEKMVGFILVGIENENSYNGGTGVLLNARGQKLTEKMYEILLPKLKADGFTLQTLEVINENFPAIKIYEKLGFQTIRTLVCLKGKINVSEINRKVEIREIEEIDETLFSSFCNAKPAWQNSFSAIARTRDLHKIIGAFIENKLVGFLIYNQIGRIKLFAVDNNFRHQKIGQTLFSQFDKKETVITNIDANDRESVLFLRKLGLEIFLRQFEMNLTV